MKDTTDRQINDEPRLECVNWDEEVSARLLSRGRGYTLRRKVKTRKHDPIILHTNVIDSAITMLRQGFEVRLAGEDGVEAIRLYPCVEKDMKKVFVAAQTVKPFRDVLGDKRVRITYRGRELSATAAVKLNEEKLSGADVGSRRGRDSVCPVRVVECPVCGNEIQLGGMKPGK